VTRLYTEEEREAYGREQVLEAKKATTEYLQGMISAARRKRELYAFKGEDLALTITVAEARAWQAVYMWFNGEHYEEDHGEP